MINILKKFKKTVPSTKPLYGIDVFFIFNSYLCIKGWANLSCNELSRVSLCYKGKKLASAETSIQGEGLIQRKFYIETLLPKGIARADLSLKLSFKGFKEITLSHKEIVETIALQRSNDTGLTQFLDLMKKNNCQSVLEIGSRARSGVARKALFGEMDYLGIDILPGENVDIVGDAHEAATLVGGKKFDAVVSMYTFEHILMPWKVALEMNKVLNIGGIGFISTHQTVGMHDLPWDYWRFSDTAWHALFNEYTGFKIIDTSLSSPMFLVPFIDHGESFVHFEKSAGFYSSIVMFEKIKEPMLSWDVPAKKIAVGCYPA